MVGVKSIIDEYQSLNLHDVIDYDKFNQFSIVHHSSSIEGSTLTENETRLLLEEGVTPKGKPLEHSLMVKDHYDALLFVLDAARKKTPVTVNFIQSINARVMRHTGGVYNTVFGEIDASKGIFRKGNVSAGGSYFVNFEKVERYTSGLVDKLDKDFSSVSTIEEQLLLSFIAHFDLVSIHPFYNGNGRTSRLLMNYIQCYFDLPLAIVYQEDKVDYYDALQQARKQEDISIFTAFMTEQYKKFLLNEMQQFRKDIGTEPSKKNKRIDGKGFSMFF
ncbi:Fic family protein [Pseudobacter ginsenosidimutans]|uniref:Fic/DOC family protein n=1 Tax=Pseudobacter ginsenosidimutans TaxID=661488 RepID=A0A4Q7MYM5_9BACT|nr:Fic family protein [Pseudobacter ginsenosidimutans]QEC42989.1 Fic family protein [Pseudobacter ginsenosidimutans]RZS74340.1 Fic/DOC family protein [Pseudobacter ginsenosidimutans]